MPCKTRHPVEGDDAPGIFAEFQGALIEEIPLIGIGRIRDHGVDGGDVPAGKRET